LSGGKTACTSPGVRRLDVASRGSTVEEALNNLKEAIELYLEDEDAHVPLEGST